MRDSSIRRELLGGHFRKTPPYANVMRIVFCRGLAVGLSLAATIVAQDVKVTPLEWINAESAPDTLPEAGRQRPPPFPPQLKGLETPAYAEISMVIDPSGKLSGWHEAATSPWLRMDGTLLDRFKPAKRDGRSVWSEVRHYVIFNPATAREKGDEATPRLLEVVPPVLADPGVLKEDRLVTVRVEVDADGAVTDAQLVAGDPNLADPAVRAVSRWNFAPARRGGVTVPSSLEVPVVFSVGLADREGTAAEQPRPLKLVRPIYPAGLRMSGQTGEVLISFIVSVEGRVRRAEVVRSSNPGFDEPALDALMQWTFQPGMRNGIPVNTRMQVPIVFSLAGEPGRSAYRFTPNPKAMAALPPEFRYDHPPEVRGAALATYPLEALKEKKGGKVKVRLVVDDKGRVAGTRVMESPREDLGLAAQAMVECFEFSPAAREGRPTASVFTFEVNFLASGTGDVPVSPAAKRLLRMLERGGREFAAVEALDGPIVPLSQRPPQFPRSVPADVQSGQAIVEFIVDERGLVQLPWIVEASLPEFGYAAVQALSSWRFRAPTVRGDAANVRVRVPVTFRR